MDTDDNETLVFIFFIPRVQIRRCSLAVDTAVCPEINEDNFFPDKTIDGDCLPVRIYIAIGSSDFFG
ncbi:MAG: hypothetical protein AAB910_03740 [Patescibacteria group bacterium]